MPEQQKNQTTNLFAIIGTRTRRGRYASRVLTSAEYKGKAFARVATWKGKPPALIGSRQSNGETTHLPFNSGYVLPAAEPAVARGDTHA
ncbi:hypothetical protein [Paraburkholderia caledonica]|uniref:hypothetical protein n=1 Tax=Paraburkholderia caledonica TaxID=134536 RepID=UPI000B48C91C|nr:hypothetical protein BWU74_18360 [Burkholderia sp. Bk]